MTTIAIPNGTASYYLTVSNVTAIVGPGTTAGYTHGTTAGAAYAVLVSGDNDLLINSGSILGHYGVRITGTGDTVSNQSGGYILSNQGVGVNATYGIAATVVNAGSIVAAYPFNAVAVVLDGGGALTNLSTGRDHRCRRRLL